MQTAPQKKILVVDDQPDFCEAISTALTHEGFKVETAQNGEEGLVVAHREHPDLIFLDIMMPGIDGVEVLKRLREDRWGKDVPVVIMTFSDDLQKIADVVGSGGTAYVLKNDLNLFEIVEIAKKRTGTA